MPLIETILSPALLAYHKLEGKTVVIIDILRATTSICYAFHNGARSMVPVFTPEECLTYRPKGFLCAGERNGLQIDGFDMGNSPEGFDSFTVNGKDIAITTTNGTYALLESQAAEHILVGSFLNLDSLCEKIQTLGKDLVLVCAGWKNKVNLEDTLFAGAVATALQGRFGSECDSTLLASELWRTHSENTENIVRQSSHARRFDKLGIDDLPFCLQLNTCNSVPVFTLGTLHL